MDTLRGNYDALEPADWDSFSAPEDDRADDAEAVHDAPPPAIGTDERRMQVRAYNFWAGLLDDRNFPSIEDLDPTLLPDFGPNSVLLDFSHGLEDPLIAYIGDQLAAECSTDGREPKRLSEVQPRSLLSRITDHYMQILANQSPIGFEAEFVNHVGASILYRGILLPFSSDDETIDFIYGVINWKDMADSKSADELLLEIDQALEDELAEPTAAHHHARDEDLTDWADGPSATNEEPAAVEPTFGGAAARPSLDLSGQADTALESVLDAEPETLADWLAIARDMAAEAAGSEERTRAALYEAVGRAWDFALAAQDAPDDFAELLGDAGIAMQDRAPMTPIVKLVFGVDYDKTRLTEYAAVLSFAARTGIGQGELGAFLKRAEGGLKGVVAQERAHRRESEGKAPKQVRKQPRKAIAKKLRALAPQGFNAVSDDGGEFGLVMIRRTETGEVVMLGEVPANASLIEKAARELIG
ncbi:PAS domain-containing protein [Aurantiacibacter aquimixticola]|uniref:Uncharacterized protein n=1 Tax=Aurantiacibacter aquimixticola TaxID=1958945 RepID=A0A419RUQ6_9SPHN|nr:hypothetical protein [Aurantiacibacter aquimixticola]RJY09515.1 hypothetical protein D6201_09235 [Aurantiacibacter aquimixticola]